MMTEQDGKRDYWYVNFANGDEKYISILVSKQEIISVNCFHQNLNEGLFDLSDINFNIENAISCCNNYGMVGGDPELETDWVYGYNFKIEYASFGNNSNNRYLVFEIIGVDSETRCLAHGDFDATTGKLLNYEIANTDANDSSKWTTIYSLF